MSLPRPVMPAAMQSFSPAKTDTAVGHGISPKTSTKVQSWAEGELQKLISTGIRWKRWKWPWVALRARSNRETWEKKNFSKTVASAEAFLQSSHPEALVPLSIIKENLLESTRLGETDESNASQGDLLALGISKVARVRGVGSQSGGRWKKLCLVFASGAQRTNVGMRCSND